MGGFAYECHSAEDGNVPHDGMADHTHHFKMNQAPPDKGCFCFWQRDVIDPTPGCTPLPGAVQVEPASGGGLEP